MAKNNFNENQECDCLVCGECAQGGELDDWPVITNEGSNPPKLNNVVDLWRSSQVELKGGSKPKRHC